EHRRRHPRHLEGDLVLEHLGGEGERHVDGIDVPGGKGVDEAGGRARHDRVLGLPPALAQEVLLVDDLARGPAELEIGEADVPFRPLRALSRREPRPAAPRERAGRRAGRHEEVPSGQGRSRRLPCHDSPPSVRLASVTRIRASMATRRSPRTLKGFRSSSATSGCATRRSPTATTTWARLSASAGGRSRKPPRSAPRHPSPSMARASPSSSGPSLSDTSRTSSAKTPPSPTTTTGPKDGSWRPPTSHSAPAGTVSCTRTGPGPSRAPRTSHARRRAPGSSTPRITPPTSVL